MAANDSFLFLREEIGSVLNQDTTQCSSLEQESVLALRTQPAEESAETKVLTEHNTINMGKTSNMEEEKEELVGGKEGLQYDMKSVSNGEIRIDILINLSMMESL